MDNLDVTSVVVKLDGLQQGILNEQLRSKICHGWKVVNTLPVEEDGELYLIFTLSKPIKENNVNWKILYGIFLLLIIQTVILSIGVFNGTN